MSVRLLLALLALALAFYALRSLTQAEIPPTNRDALMVALGIVLGLSKDAFNFFFGTTQGSADKTAILADQAKGQGEIDEVKQ